jgi:hypothetical protein
VAGRSTELGKYSTVKFSDGNSWLVIGRNRSGLHVLGSSSDVVIILQRLLLCVYFTDNGRYHVNLKELTTQNGLLAPGCVR